MSLFWRVFSGLALAAGCLGAQPSVCSVINDAVASGLAPGIQVPVCPGYRSVVARGSIISVTGTNLGPGIEERATDFPLRTSLAGASVRLTVGGIGVDAFVLSAQQNHIQAMVPSGTPLGEGVLVVTTNAGQAAPHKLKVAGRYFQIYPRGPLALAQNIGSDGTPQDNDFTAPARPGQTLTLWGTGLGAVEGNEAAGPAPSSSSGAGVEVLLGLQRAHILYAGRSDCCAGLDKIVIETPAGIEGCSVPVVVRPLLDDFAGAFPHVAVASRGACSDPHGIPESVRQQIGTNGGGRIGYVLLGQYGWSADGVSAYFTRFGNRFVTPAGACGYPPATNSLGPGPDDNYYWGAGPDLKLRGAFGELEAPEDLDNHNTAFGSFYERGFVSSDLEPGTYAIHNEGGGADVGAFRFTFPIGAEFQWTNRSTLNTVQAGQDLTLTWAAGERDDGYVAINGTFLTFTADRNGYGLGVFTCLERADKGAFTVPGWMIWTDRVAAAEVLDLEVQHYRRQEFTAPGLDFGEFLHARKPESQRANITGR